MYPDHSIRQARHRHGFSRRAYLRMGLMSGAVLVGLTASGCAWGEGHRRHWGGWRHGAWRDDPDAAKEHAQEMARWLLKSIDATEEQHTRINGIVGKLVDDVQPLISQHQSNRDAMFAAFTGESVDRDALNQLRQADLELADKAYGRFTDALADIAEVLTREQRLELAEAAHRFRRWH